MDCQRREMNPMDIKNHTAAVVALIHNNNTIIFVDGHIVHPNEKGKPQPDPWRVALLQEIAAHATVIAAASSIAEDRSRSAINDVAVTAMNAKAKELAQKSG